MGIKARGGFEVSMQWDKGEVTEVTVLSSLGDNLRIRSYVPLTGKGLKEAKGKNANRFFERVNITSPVISTQASFKGSALKKVYEYDITTKVGGKYTFKRAE